MRYDLFLAHASADKAVANQLYDALTALGVKPFSTLAPSSRESVRTASFHARRTPRATVVLVTRACDDAFYVGEEIATAIARHREAPDAHSVIPAHLEGIPADAFALPYSLRVINRLDVPALGGVVGLAARLCELVTKWRGAPLVPPPPAAATDPRCSPALLRGRWQAPRRAVQSGDPPCRTGTQPDRRADRTVEPTRARRRRDGDAGRRARVSARVRRDREGRALVDVTEPLAWMTSPSRNG
ncbi:MAG: TIR domain-containing protein [Polyangiales bacterium]